MYRPLLVLLPLLGNALVLRTPPVTGNEHAPLVAEKTASKPMQLSTEDKKAAHFGCVKACKPSPVESKCVTACEAAHYQCIDIACQQANLEHFTKTKGVEKKKEKKEEKGKKGEGKKGDKKADKKKDAKKEEKKKKKKAALLGAMDTPLVAQKAAGKPMQLSTEDKKAAHFGCVKACKPSPVESKCVTACEAAHYQCIDIACQEANLEHFTKTKGVEKKKKEEKKEEKGKGKKGDKKAEKKDAKKEDKKKKAALIGAADAPLVAGKAASKPMQLSTEDKKAAHFGCVKACKPSPVESKCVTACEAAHYQCIDIACQQANLEHFTKTKGVEKKEEKKEKKEEKGKKGGDKKEKKKDAKKEEKKAKK